MSNELLNRLVSKSTLTRAQFETLLLQKRVISGEIGSRAASSNRRPYRRGTRPSGVSLGSYHRVLHQARKNIEKSLVTVLLSTNLAIIDEKEFLRLIDLLSTRRMGEDSGRIDEILVLIEEIVSKIVTL